jgi:hypothetical protein
MAEFLAADHWKGSFTIALNPPTEEWLMRINPFGIYVMDIAWTKVSGVFPRKDQKNGPITLLLWSLTGRV